LLGLRVIAVGKIKNKAIDALCAEYAKRLSRYAKIEISEVKDARGDDAAANRAREAERVGDQLARSGTRSTRLVALDEGGEQLASRQLSRWLQREADSGYSSHTFLIGGPDGLDPTLLQRAQKTVSLSRMTFTHEMARALLLEQLYRAMTIWRGEPYHRS